VTCEETIVAADIRLHPSPEPDRDPGEAHEHSVRSDPALVAQGWTRRNLADPARAREAIDLYESLGFEVKVARLTPADLGPACRDCAPDICRAYVLLYTRRTDDSSPRPGESSPDASRKPLVPPGGSNGSNSAPA
jgi:hypothetical protein